MANSSLWPVAHTPVLDDRFTGSEAHVGMGTLHTRRSVIGAGHYWKPVCVQRAFGSTEELYIMKVDILVC